MLTVTTVLVIILVTINFRIAKRSKSANPKGMQYPVGKLPPEIGGTQMDQALLAG